MPQPPRPRLVAAGVTLRRQVDQAFPKRDRRSDGWIGDKAHQARQSDHNPDARGWVHALDIDADLYGPKRPGVGRDTAWVLAEQLREYARRKRPGSERLKYIVYRDQICSGTYANTFWTWRGKGYGHMSHIHVSFTAAAEDDGLLFAIPILLDGAK
jgi:hypothetical protein